MQSRIHSNCVVCSSSNHRGLQLEFEPADGGRVQARFGCDEAFEGYEGVLHGGVLAALLDGAMTNCMFAHGIPAVTGQLSIRFRHPVLAGKEATVHAWLEQSWPPLHLLKAEIVQGAQIKATASGKFMEQPRPSSKGRTAGA
jgi:uncharacterized protein (TIGR00369 family)